MNSLGGIHCGLLLYGCIAARQTPSDSYHITFLIQEGILEDPTVNAFVPKTQIKDTRLSAFAQFINLCQVHPFEIRSVYEKAIPALLGLSHNYTQLIIL
jgi:hypothetical protein